MATSDQIRNALNELNIQLKDGKDGTTFTIENKMTRYYKYPIIIFISSLLGNVYSQVSKNYVDSIFEKKGEQYFSFDNNNQIDLSYVSKLISIDHKSNENMIYAYANKAEFIDFFEIKYNLINDDIKIPVSNFSKSSWNYYPNYQEYEKYDAGFC